MSGQDEQMRIQNRLQEGVNTMVDQIQVHKTNPMQKQMYLQMADCCDLKQQTAMQSCLERASMPVKVAQNIIQNEMSQFENRIARCSQDCSDQVRDSFANQDSSNPNVQEKAMRKANACMSTCVDKHLALLKGLKARIEKDIDAKIG